MNAERVSSTAPVESKWEGIVAGDYDRGVIRVATFCREKVNHLLFASVELLPPEMPSPPYAGRSLNCGTDRLYFTRDVLPLDVAMAWYLGCQTATVRPHPSAKTIVVIGALAAEPPVRSFVLRDDVPFSPTWHVIPRMHRLVGMDPLGAPIAELVAKMVDVDRFRRARRWLADQLYFDILAHDDWLGSVALMAPNPMFGSSHVRIAPPSGGPETVIVSGRRRFGASLLGLKVVFEERRVAGSGFYAEGAIDRVGAATVTIDGGVEELGHKIVCERRGLLHESQPGWFFRSVSTHTRFPVQSRSVTPRRRSAGNKPLNNSVWRASASSIAPTRLTAVMRLEQLQRLRLDRFGEYRPLRSAGENDALRVFEVDREEPLLFIRRLIARARRRIMLIDPYLVAADLREFAYAAEEEAETSVLFELISARYERRSTLITANQPFGEWGRIFPDPAMTLAAVDRLVHHATIFEMNVESYRRRTAVQRQSRAGRPPTYATIKTIEEGATSDNQTTN